MSFSRLAAASAAWMLVVPTSSPTTVQASEPSLDPAAVALLRRTTEHVGGLQQFSVDAQTTFEDLLDSGHRVDYELWSSVAVRRPNKLRTERHGDGINQVFYFDGEFLSLFNPADKVYATEAAPDTIEEMFQFAYDTFGISTPVSDLVHRDAFEPLMQGVTLAVVVGREVLRGVTCDHLLFSRPGVDFQIWVAHEGSPLPMKYVVTDTSTPRGLSISTAMSGWNESPKVPDSLFEFVPPQDALPIPFLKADTLPASED